METIDINIFETPDVDAGMGGEVSCINPELMLSATVFDNDLNIQWTGPGILSGGTTTMPTVTVEGWYYINIESMTTGCTNVDSVFVEAGFPKGLFSNLFISNEQAADVISHKHVKAVTLTGSERTH